MDTVGYLGLGILHEQLGIPCQDALACGRLDNGSRVWVLSDGAGSAEFAAEAARGNIRGVLDYFEAHSLDDFLRLPPEIRREELLRACRQRLAEISEEFEDRIWDFSATLLFFVQDSERWVAGHLGDGFLTVLDREGRMLVCSEPENREQSNRTYFTVSSDAARHLRLYTDPERRPGQLLMVSDGPCEMFRTRDRSLENTARELLGYARDGEITSAQTLAEVLDQMNFYALDRRDDWSVLIWREGADYGPWSEPEVRSMLEQEMKKNETEA